MVLKEHPGLGDLEGDERLAVHAAVAAKWAAAASEGLVVPPAGLAPAAAVAALAAAESKRSSPEVTVEATGRRGLVVAAEPVFRFSLSRSQAR